MLDLPNSSSTHTEEKSPPDKEDLFPTSVLSASPSASMILSCSTGVAISSFLEASSAIVVPSASNWLPVYTYIQKMSFKKISKINIQRLP